MFCFLGVSTNGLPYNDLYMPNQMGSAGGGHTSTAGKGGGRIAANIKITCHIDGDLSANGGDATLNGQYVGGGGSGGSILLNCTVLKGYGTVAAKGGDGSYYYYRNPHNGHVTQRGGGGGGGGRLGTYFQVIKN